MLTGVNDSSKKINLFQVLTKLVEGEHLTDKDHNQILLLHEGFS